MTNLIKMLETVIKGSDSNSISAATFGAYPKETSPSPFDLRSNPPGQLARLPFAFVRVENGTTFQNRAAIQYQHRPLWLSVKSADGFPSIISTANTQISSRGASNAIAQIFLSILRAKRKCREKEIRQDFSRAIECVMEVVSPDGRIIQKVVNPASAILLAEIQNELNQDDEFLDAVEDFCAAANQLVCEPDTLTHSQWLGDYSFAHMANLFRKLFVSEFWIGQIVDIHEHR